MSKLGSKLSDTYVADLTGASGSVVANQTGAPMTTFTDGDTTPDVSGSNALLASNTAPTNITNFDNGVEGQLIRVHFTNGNTTIVHDVTKIKMLGGANVTAGTNTTRTFSRDASNIWWEIGGSGAAFATPSIALGSSAAGGSAASVIRSDSTIAAFDTTVPTVSHPGDTAAVGSAAFAARRDHTHGREDYAFFDDFTGEPAADPFPGASGTWRLGSSASAGSSSLNLDSTINTNAVGVWVFQSGTAVGGSHIAISPENGSSFTLSLIPGLEFGARLRIDGTYFTRGLVSFGLTDANLSGSNSQQGTKRLAFLIWVTDNDYYTAGGLGTDIAIFESASGAGGSNYQSLDTGSAGSTFTAFTNIKMVVTAEQTVDCYVNGTNIGTLSGAKVPASTVNLALRLRMQTNGTANPANNQKSYFDRIYIDARRVSRGAN